MQISLYSYNTSFILSDVLYNARKIFNCLAQYISKNDFLGINYKFFVKVLVILSIVILLSDCAFAAGANDEGVYDRVLGNLRDTLKGYKDKLALAGTWLFWTLALISLVWSFGQVVTQNGEMGSIFGSLIRWMIVTGFFWYLLQNGADVLLKGANTFKNWGQSFSSNAPTSPSDMVTRGLAVIFGGDGGNKSFIGIAREAFNAGAEDAGWDFGQYITCLMTYLFCCIIAAFLGVLIVVMGFNMFMALATFYCVSYLGVFLMGLAGASFTRNMAIPYLQTLLKAGIKVFAMSLIVAVGFDLLVSQMRLLCTMVNNDQEGAWFSTVIDTMVVAYLFYLVASKLPDMIANLVGGVDLSAGQVDAGKAAGFAAKAAVGGGALAAVGAGAGLAKGIAGGIKGQGAGGKIAGALKGVFGGAGGIVAGGLRRALNKATGGTFHLSGKDAEQGASERLGSDIKSAASAVKGWFN